jgi:hypothetical protein
MRYRPGALAVVGSNPTGPTESSVQILQNNKRSTSSTTAKTKNIKVESKVLTNTKSYEMRDLRKERYLQTIPETIRVILGEHFRKS